MQSQPGYMSLRLRLVLAGALFAGLISVGTLGFTLIEGWSPLYAAYVTVITATTVAFVDPRPLSDGGRVFNIFLAVVSVIAFLYVLSLVLQVVFEGELAQLLGVRRMKGKIERLRDHYILCGFGRVGEEIAREFTARGVPFVVVESNPEAIARAQAQAYPLVEGDSTREAMLRQAGVERAKCLLAASDSDAGNTFIILTARSVNPQLFLIARAALPESEERMQRAGADRIFSPYQTAGRQMALSALQPLAVEFMEMLATGQTPGSILAEIEVSQESGLGGQTLGDVLHDAHLVVALGLQKASGTIQVGPAAETVLQEGDRLIVMGREEELEAIRPRGPGSETSA